MRLRLRQHRCNFPNLPAYLQDLLTQYLQFFAKHDVLLAYHSNQGLFYSVVRPSAVTDMEEIFRSTSGKRHVPLFTRGHRF
jgi:hypothetical protein